MSKAMKALEQRLKVDAYNVEVTRLMHWQDAERAKFQARK